MKRIPLLPTLIVLIAVGIMVRLGFWQLDRLHQKEAMLARFEAASGAPDEVAWPTIPTEFEPALFHRSQVDCLAGSLDEPLAGRSDKGQPGWSHEFSCRTSEGSTAFVVLGWSSSPTRVTWTGGRVTGVVGPRGKQGIRLIADSPLAGLQPNAKPDPRDIPNNHLSYAVQWFAFAAIALVIYGLALRKRMRP